MRKSKKLNDRISKYGLTYESRCDRYTHCDRARFSELLCYEGVLPIIIERKVAPRHTKSSAKQVYGSGDQEWHYFKIAIIYDEINAFKIILKHE